MHGEAAHEIALDLPLAEAMPLFTPKGEEAWLTVWEPRCIAPATGDTCEEMLFVTEHGGETTFWTCLKWRPDPDARPRRLPAARLVERRPDLSGRNDAKRLRRDDRRLGALDSRDLGVTAGPVGLLAPCFGEVSPTRTQSRRQGVPLTGARGLKPVSRESHRRWHRTTESTAAANRRWAERRRIA